MFNFVADRITRDKAYPALSTWTAEPYTPEWQRFVSAWPYTIPCELHEHCAEFNVPYRLWSINDAYPPGSYYTVGVGFFDFSVDYFGLMSGAVQAALRTGRLTALFYYHEGDNPYTIKERLDDLCLAWRLPSNCYRFVSGNTAARNIPGFVYFPDHELLYWRRNKNVAPSAIHTQTRSRDFTALSRTHKWWRATAMADLHRNHLLDNSYWSYNTQVTINDRPEDNPIEIDTLGIRNYLTEFLDGGPYRADAWNDSQHNDHSQIEVKHFTDSSCHIVLETHFDADQSGGTFLTEKTFKAIKHGQPFVIVGPAGSLEALRRLGYRTFDHAIDNTYDLETGNTQRWIKVVDSIQQIKQQDLGQWVKRCRSDAEHNQQLFVSTKADRLNNLLTKLKTL
jgi:hypothetical protein